MNMGVGLIRLVARFLVGQAAREGAVEAAERLTGRDLPGNFLIEAVEDLLGKPVQESTEAEVETAISELQKQGRIPPTAEAFDPDEIETMSTETIDYSDWISIAFQVAREKGARFETTQSEIQAGEAPTSDAVRLFAEIWNDRKLEMTSATAARRIAEAEIQV